MSGNFFLDTNAIIELLKGNNRLYKLIINADNIFCSVISELEYISFLQISDDDKLLLAKFLERIYVVDVNHSNKSLKEEIAYIRKMKKIKLPDSIILASAKINDCTLITADKDLLKLNNYIDIIDF